jgi:hypothetical protein
MFFFDFVVNMLFLIFSFIPNLFAFFLFVVFITIIFLVQEILLLINIGVGGEFPDFSPCEFITNNGANKIDTMFTSNNFTGVLQSHSILDF